jgi:uncharacterized membrane protein YhaH (DUF805 family)
MNYYKAVLKKYAEFKGRARRAEYWYFALFNIIFAIVAGIIDRIIDPGVKISGYYGIIYILYALAVIVPSLAVVVRRLHDTGKSGWMILISLIPIVGAIWLLVLMIKKGDVGENKYGPDPKMLPGTPVQPTPVQS